MLLRADKLGRSVPGKVLVTEATFEVRKAEILAIVGPSGSGKSSLLRLLNRLDEPTEGNVYLDEVDYRQIAPRELRRRVGMVMQTAVPVCRNSSRQPALWAAAAGRGSEPGGGGRIAGRGRTFGLCIARRFQSVGWGSAASFVCACAGELSGSFVVGRADVGAG